MIQSYLYALAIVTLLLLPQTKTYAKPPRVAVLGDSITFAGHWVVRVESALRTTQEFAESDIVNFGLGSETISGLSENGHAGGAFPRPCLHDRLARILQEFKPTHVLACYGMNDGIYQPLDNIRFEAFRKGAETLKSEVESSDAKIIFITPPLYKADHPEQDTQRYDRVLEHYATWLNQQGKSGWHVIDIRPRLHQAISTAKMSNSAFLFAKDGIHPGKEGHQFMADAISNGLWKIWRLPGSPVTARDPALEILSKRSSILKLAWLSKTKHNRPGVPAGLPLEQAQRQADQLLARYRAATSGNASH